MKRAIKKYDGTKRSSVRTKPASATQDIVGTGRGSPAVRGRIKPNWAWHCRALLRLRDRFLKERDERLREAAEPLEPHSMDIADSATDEFDRDMALRELSAEQVTLFEINAALERILNGTYGLCEETGQPIPAARLRAIPWTRFSKEVEVRLETKGVVGRARLGEVGSVRSPAESGSAETKTPNAED